MQYWLYNISIFAYTILVFTISPFHKKGKKWIRGRRNWLVKLQDIRKTSENWIWFHCSSLGEYEDCCEVFFAIQKRHPNSKTLLTFFSPSGYEAIEKSAEFDAVMYLPVDSMSRVNSFLDHLRPKLVVFARSEIWLNYLRGIRERKIPLFLIALKMNEKSGFLKHPKLYRNGFESFTHIYCQDETTQYLLKERFGVGNSSVIGNTRFERICKESLAKKEFPEISRFVGKDFCIIAGSYLTRDLNKILPVIPEFLHFGVKIILVPHEVNHENIWQLEKTFGSKLISYSNIGNLNDQHNLLVIDHVGSLKHIYKYAHLAIIGGGFDSIGIHNIIEPSIYGLVTLFGPNHKNYREAIDLMDLGGSFVFNDSAELLKIVRKHVKAAKTKETVSEQIKNYVKANATDSHEIALHIEHLIA